MSGAAHLRIIVAVFFVGGILAIGIFTVLPLFLDDMNFIPFVWVNGSVAIGLAIWLYRGSNIARILLIVISAFGIVSWGYLFAETVGYSWTVAAVWGIAAVLSVYCLSALAFSKDVRDELARRRDADVK
jgi:hypothetical protein